MKLSSLRQTHEKRIAVFGGSFNPFHNGHLAVVKCLARRFDEVWLMPCNQHPLGKELAPARHRSAMCELGIQGIENARVSQLEIERGGISYTIDTVRLLRRKYPLTDFSWVIGEDSLKNFSKWRDSSILKNEVDFVVVSRRKINPPFGRNLVCKTPKISSTQVRKKVKKGFSISKLVPEKVEDYIHEHNLYR